LAIPHFSAASSKFRGKRQIPQCGMKIHVPWNTAGLAILRVMLILLLMIMVNVVLVK